MGSIGAILSSKQNRRQAGKNPNLFAYNKYNRITNPMVLYLLYSTESFSFDYFH